MSSKTDGNEDEDCLFLEHVLDKLYDFGDGPTSNKKVKSHKKNKRKRCEEEEQEEEEVPTGISCKDHRADRSETVQKPQQPTTQPTGPTIQSLNQVEVVTFQDPRKKLKTKETPAPDKTPTVRITDKKQNKQPEELSLEKARLEVHRFGITGYKKEEQRVFEQERAIMLGARPPKKSYVNYKMLQEQIKDKKQKEKEEVEPDLKKKKKKKKNERDKKKKVSSGSGSAPSGQLGRFKNGMLVLSTKEIQKIKSNKRRK